MPWPWPDREVQRFTEKARRAMVDNPHGPELSRRFLLRLATGELVPVDCPNRACRRGEPIVSVEAWVKSHSLRNLAGHIITADDHDFTRTLRIRGLAVAEAGRPRRRGDIIHIRTRPSFWDMRKQ